MALSMEEQRILVEIETYLTRDDPELARRLSVPVRGRRVRLVMFAVVLAAAAVVVAAVV